MSKNGIDALRAEVGATAAGKLPDFSGVSDAAVAELVAAVREAKLNQRRLLEQNRDHALRLVPGLLRPAVRKILFG